MWILRGAARDVVGTAFALKPIVIGAPRGYKQPSAWAIGLSGGLDAALEFYIKGSLNFFLRVEGAIEPLGNSVTGSGWGRGSLSVFGRLGARSRRGYREVLPRAYRTAGMAAETIAGGSVGR